MGFSSEELLMPSRKPWKKPARRVRNVRNWGWNSRDVVNMDDLSLFHQPKQMFFFKPNMDDLTVLHQPKQSVSTCFYQKRVIWPYFTIFFLIPRWVVFSYQLQANDKVISFSLNWWILLRESQSGKLFLFFFPQAERRILQHPCIFDWTYYKCSVYMPNWASHNVNYLNVLNVAFRFRSLYFRVTKFGKHWNQQSVQGKVTAQKSHCKEQSEQGRLNAKNIHRKEHSLQGKVTAKNSHYRLSGLYTGFQGSKIPGF